MKTERLKCPRCKKQYPAVQLVLQIGWRMRCPACDTRLAFSQRSAGRIGAIAGLTFGAIIVLKGGDSILTWPTFAWFMLFAFVIGRILALLLGELDVAPDKMSFDPFPNQKGIWKTLSVGSLVAMVVLGLSGFFWKYLPPWGIFTLSGIMLPVGVILLIVTVHNLAGKNEILRRQDKSGQAAPPYSEPSERSP
jgi:DNA-directed RNA polymerase subunit RPC12/RpoP